MKKLETALEAQDKNDQRAYDKLSDYGKSVCDERRQNARLSRNFYGNRIFRKNRPKVHRAIR